MKTIAVIFHSVTGTTKSIAHAICEGVQSVEGVSVNLLRINGKDIINGRYNSQVVLESISRADAVIFGSPTYMGSVSAQFKAFADASSEIWSVGGWTNKIAAGFTVGSCYAGDQEVTMQYFQTLANQHGMLWAGIDMRGIKRDNIPNLMGAQSGVIAKSEGTEIHQDDLITAQYLGRRVAHLLIG